MIKRLLNKSDFLKNVTTLITGTVLAQLIPIILQPVLSRIYNPEEFGTFTIYLSIIGMLAPAANLKYEGAIILPDSDKKASALAIGSILISFLFSLIWLFIFILFDDQIITTFNFSPSIKIWLLLIPLGIFIISSSRVFNYWLIRKKAFSASSINKLVRRSSEGISQFGIGEYSKHQGLIIGNLIGEFLNFIVSCMQSVRNKLSLKNISFSDIKEQLKRYKDFPLYSFAPSLMNSVSLFLPAIIINQYYTLELTGQFGFSRQLLSVPLAFISIALSQVLVQKVAESSRLKKKILPLIFKITIILVALSLVGIIVLELFGVELFKWVFGEKWETAGRLSQILVFSYAIKFVVSPLTAIFTALEKIKISSLWQIGYFVLIGLLYLLKDLSIEEFLLYYVLIDLVSYLIYYVLLVGVCKKYDNNISK
jgi:O-antigen/teichoic acid export membrane protein